MNTTNMNTTNMNIITNIITKAAAGGRWHA